MSKHSRCHHCWELSAGAIMEGCAVAGCLPAGCLPAGCVCLGETRVGFLPVLMSCVRSSSGWARSAFSLWYSLVVHPLVSVRTADVTSLLSMRIRTADVISFLCVRFRTADVISFMSVRFRTADYDVIRFLSVRFRTAVGTMSCSLQLCGGSVYNSRPKDKL